MADNTSQKLNRAINETLITTTVEDGHFKTKTLSSEFYTHFHEKNRNLPAPV